nr:hypothetical protein [Tanacetum cinerariifolium]
MSANDKFGLGYEGYRYGSILSYENEVLQSVFMNKESDLENTFVNDRYAARMHEVPPPMTGNYMPSGPDVEINYSKFTYGSKQTSVDESDSKPSEYAFCESDSSVETTTSMRTPVENVPKVVCKPKVWIDAPIVEDYESDSDDDSVSNVQEVKEKPSFADSVKHVKPSRENVKERGTPNHSPKVEKQDRNGHTRNGLGYAFTRRACFVCEFKGGYVAFGGNNGRITGKRKIKAGRLDFEDVYYVEELKHYNLFSVSQMCDKKNKVLFTDTDCLVLSPDFKLPDENQVLLKIPRQHNMYSFNLKNIDPSRDLACLFAKALIDESNKWHKRLGHVNFKNLNKFVKGNLVRGLPSKILKNDHTCVACQKESNTRPLDETTPILKDFIRKAENQFNHKVKTIRSDNGTEFKNNELIKFRGLKGIKREYSNARTPQQNGVAKRKNRTLIETARTMLADSFLPTTFWAEAVNTACYVLNRVLVTKPQNKTPYELLTVENQANKFAGPKDANNSAGKEANDAPRKEATHQNQNANTNNTNLLNAISTPISTAGPSRALNDGEASYPDDPLMPHLEDIYASLSEGIFTDSSYDDEGVTRSKVNKNSEAHALISKALEDKSWVDAMQEELLQFQIQKGHRQKEGIDYDEVFAHVARIEAIRIFFAFASYMGFIVYQMDVKSAFLYNTIDEESMLVLDSRKSTTRGCQFLGKRLISWQCKKQTIVATSTTKTEYVDAAHFCRQVLWIQNQLLDYGFNIMNTKIYIDNESTICVVKNPVFHTKTKHIEIWHHFIRDAYEKKLIQLLKIHTDDNVADLLTMAFDVSSKELASPKQMALGKDKLNPLIVDSLLKTIWLSMHHVVEMKHWLFQSKQLLANDVVKLQALIDGKRVVVIEDLVRQALRLDDADGVEYLPNEEIFTELAHMGYENPPLKLTFYKAFFFAQWKFLIHTLV